jgi:hypothetical protein
MTSTGNKKSNPQCVGYVTLPRQDQIYVRLLQNAELESVSSAV